MHNNTCSDVIKSNLIVLIASPLHEHALNLPGSDGKPVGNPTGQGSGVATYGALGHVPSPVWEIIVHSVAAAS